MKTYFFFFHETMFKINSMQSDTTVVSIAAVIIIATYGKKNCTDS